MSRKSNLANNFVTAPPRPTKKKKKKNKKKKKKKTLFTEDNLNEDCTILSFFFRVILASFRVLKVDEIACKFSTIERKIELIAIILFFFFFFSFFFYLCMWYAYHFQ